MKRTFIAALFAVVLVALLWASPTYANSAISKRTGPLPPQVTISCGSVAGVLTISHQATQEVTQYRVSFTAQGVGRMISYSIPIYYWIQTAINSPSSGQPYTDVLTVDDPYYQSRPTGVGMYVQSAACSIYGGNMTITNASIVPLN